LLIGGRLGAPGPDREGNETWREMLFGHRNGQYTAGFVRSRVPPPVTPKTQKPLYPAEQ
jgi:hypothetical protein